MYTHIRASFPLPILLLFSSSSPLLQSSGENWTGVGAPSGGPSYDVRCEGCPDGFFSDVSSTAECRKWSKCAKGFGLSVKGTNASDSVCAKCDGTSTYSDVFDYSACKPVSGCDAGEQIDMFATQSNDTVCEACGANTFSVDGVVPCATHDTCEVGTGAAVAATATNDLVCEACAAGTFATLPSRGTCAPYTTCAVGLGVVPGTTSSKQADLRCKACAEGTFSDKDDLRECKEHRKCPIGMGAVEWDGTPFKPGDKRRMDMRDSWVPMLRSESELARMMRLTKRPVPIRDFVGMNTAVDLVVGKTAATAAAKGGRRPPPRWKMLKVSLPAPSPTIRHGELPRQARRLQEQRRRLACTRDGSFCHPDYDVGCQNCSWGGFFSNTDATELCQACSPACPTGMREESPCTTDHDRVCVPTDACVGNMWSATGTEPCGYMHTPCPIGEGLLPGGEANRFRDAICVACDETRTYSNSSDMTPCRDHSDCPAGFEPVSRGTRARDTLCSACEAGKYNPVASKDKCIPCSITTCGTRDKGLVELAKCTTTTDGKCEKEPPRWKVGPYGTCSCLGIQRRMYLNCIVTIDVALQDGSLSTSKGGVPDSFCPLSEAGPKPANTRVCIPSQLDCPDFIDPGGDNNGGKNGTDGGNDAVNGTTNGTIDDDWGGLGGDGGKPGPGRDSAGEFPLIWLGWLLPLLLLLLLLLCCCLCFFCPCCIAMRQRSHEQRWKKKFIGPVYSLRHHGQPTPQVEGHNAPLTPPGIQMVDLDFDMAIVPSNAPVGSPVKKFETNPMFTGADRTAITAHPDKPFAVVEKEI